MKYIKSTLKYTLATIVALLLIVNVFILVTGRTYLYKGIANTYLKGRSGPSINESELFENRMVKVGVAQPTPHAANYNKIALSTTQQQFADSFGTIAFVVIKNDSLVHEQYWDGFDDKSHTNSFSMAKSIVAMLVGVAINDGKITSVDDPITKYLPEFKAMENSKLGTITIRHLLTMSSGVNFDEDYVNPLAYPAEAYYGDDLKKLTLQSHYKATEEPGVYFKYHSGDTQLLTFVLEAATGEHVADYASKKLWSKIGTTNEAWWNLDHKDGNEKSFCCFNSNAPDFARIGSLILHYGKWNGQQVVDSAYVVEMTSLAKLKNPKTEATITNYGFQWWLVPNYKGHNIVYMRGKQGQYVAIIRDLNLVVCRLGHQQSKLFAGEDHRADFFKFIDIALDMTK
jgi:CubicO group peptidase (beta-lactamase class C family)